MSRDQRQNKNEVYGSEDPNALARWLKCVISLEHSSVINLASALNSRMTENPSWATPLKYSDSYNVKQCTCADKHVFQYTVCFNFYRQSKSCLLKAF